MVFEIYTAGRKGEKKDFGESRDPGPKGLGNELEREGKVEQVGSTGRNVLYRLK